MRFSSRQVQCKSISRTMEFPVLSHKTLHVTQLGTRPNHLFTVQGLLTPDESQACIEYAESLRFSHQSSRGPAYGEAFRDNDRVSVQDQGIADAIWHSTGLSKLLKSIRVEGTAPTGCNPNIRFYRYLRGHRFGRHIDDSVEMEGGGRTWYTVLIYLSGCLEGQCPEPGQVPHDHDRQETQQNTRLKKQKASAGLTAAEQTTQAADPRAVQNLVGGETAFYSDRGKLVASVRPSPGLALLHLHGEDRCMEHEALVVKHGSKYVLRTDIVFQ